MDGKFCKGSRAGVKISRQFAYSLAAGAIVGTAPEAEAVIVYSGVEDLTIAQGFFQHLRLDADGKDDIRLENFVLQGGNYQGAFLPFYPARLVGKEIGGLKYARALDDGYLVDNSNVNQFDVSLAYEDVNPNAEFINAESKYIGFRFPIFLDEINDIREPHFAWIRVSINNAAGTFVVHDWAYESDAETPIVTGDRGAAGDFNDDGSVDAVDYTVWRNNLGTNHILAGHGDENGDSLNLVDMDDYTLWKANYGWVAPAEIGAGGVAPVPEPGALGLLAAGSFGLSTLRRRHRG